MHNQLNFGTRENVNELIGEEVEMLEQAEAENEAGIEAEIEDDENELRDRRDDDAEMGLEVNEANQVHEEMEIAPRGALSVMSFNKVIQSQRERISTKERHSSTPSLNPAKDSS
jgi:hypothetical protein